METSLSRKSDLNAGQWKNSPGCQSKEWTEIDNFLGYGFAAAFDIAYVGCLFILEGHLHIPVGIRACWWHMEHRRCIVEAGDQLALLCQMHSIISTATFFCSYLDQLWNVPVTCILPGIPKKMQCFSWRTLKTVSWVSVSPSNFQESFFWLMRRGYLILLKG